MRAQPPPPVVPEPGAVRRIFRRLLLVQASIILAGIAYLVLR